MAIPAIPTHGASWDAWGAAVDATARTSVLKWQPSTAYTAGDIVINPTGQTVTANATFTSGASYSAANWSIVGGGTDATTTVKGIVQLAGDLAGTAASPTVPGLAAKLNVTVAASTYVAKVDAIDLESTQDSIAGMFTGGTHTGISFAYNDPGNVINATVTAPGALTPTATKTTAYTAVVGDLAMMNVAGGATVLTLPTAPANKAQVGYRAIGATSGTPLTINRGGTDTIGTAGATTASIPLADETVILQYDAPNTRWLGIANVRTQASVDARYDAAGAATTAQAFAIQRANHTGTQAVSTIAATGTPSSTTYLRGDGSWATPAGGGGTGLPVAFSLFMSSSASSGRAYVLGGSGGNVSSTLNANGQLQLVPFFVERSATFTLGLKCTTAGSAGAVARLGVWNDATLGYPGTLLTDVGTITATAIDGVAPAQYTTTSVALTAGTRYWIGVALQGAPTTLPVFAALNTPSWTVLSNGSGEGHSLKVTGITGALADSPAGTTLSAMTPGFQATLMPRVYFKES